MSAGSLSSSLETACRRSATPLMRVALSRWPDLRRQPDHVDEMARHLALGAVAVHLGEERLVAHAAGVDVEGRRRAGAAQRIGRVEHVLEVGVGEAASRSPSRPHHRRRPCACRPSRRCRCRRSRRENPDRRRPAPPSGAGTRARSSPCGGGATATTSMAAAASAGKTQTSDAWGFPWLTDRAHATPALLLPAGPSPRPCTSPPSPAATSSTA